VEGALRVWGDLGLKLTLPVHTVHIEAPKTYREPLHALRCQEHGTILIKGDRLQCLRGGLIIVDPFNGQQSLLKVDYLDRICTRENPPELDRLFLVLDRGGCVP
jgi:hypothetical protein